MIAARNRAASLDAYSATKMKPMLYIALMSTVVSTVSASSITSLMRTVGSCEMNCERGFCEKVEGDHVTHRFLFQEGRMLQRCSCPYGWTGTGCELEVQQCDMNSLTCPNGSPCAVNEKGSHHCDCAVADRLSTFASQQCRRPYTEYCSASYDPNKPLSFCTNGGVCRGSVMAAEAAPGNTSVNALYEHEGCICPREYYGPHCEFIHRSLPPVSKDQAQVEAPKNPSTSIPTPKTDPTEPKKGSPKNIQDLIRDYSEFGGNGNAGTSSNAEDSGSSVRDGTLMKYLMGLLAFIVLGIVFIGCKVMRYRRRSRNQAETKGSRKGPKAGEKSKTTPFSVRTKSGREPMKNPNVKKPKVKRANMQKKKNSNLAFHQGTADLSPFAIDGEEGEDEQTLATWDSSSHHQEVMAHSNEASGGWVAAVSRHIDTYVGTNRYEQAQEYIVDEGDDDDVVSDIYSVSNESQHPYMIDDPDESSRGQQGDTYMIVGDDDDEDDGCLYYHQQTRRVQQTTHQASLWGDSWD